MVCHPYAAGEATCGELRHAPSSRDSEPWRTYAEARAAHGFLGLKRSDLYQPAVLDPTPLGALRRRSQRRRRAASRGREDVWCVAQSALYRAWGRDGADRMC